LHVVVDLICIMFACCCWPYLYNVCMLLLTLFVSFLHVVVDLICIMFACCCWPYLYHVCMLLLTF